MSEATFFLLKVRAVPNAKKTQVVGFLGEALKIKVQAVPEGGRANRELTEFLVGALGLPRGNVSVQTGETARDKLIRVEGLTREDALKRLGVA
ncbi:MAG: DUF167 domain-containing protein [Candidatus Spyradosoma sp.]